MCIVFMRRFRQFLRPFSALRPGAATQAVVREPRRASEGGERQPSLCGSQPQLPAASAGGPLRLVIEVAARTAPCRYAVPVPADARPGGTATGRHFRHTGDHSAPAVV